MLEISDAVISVLRDALTEQEEPDSVFRLVYENRDIVMKIAPIEEGDVIYEPEGVPVVAAPNAIAEVLDQRTLEVENTAEGPRLYLSA